MTYRSQMRPFVMLAAVMLLVATGIAGPGVQAHQIAIPTVPPGPECGVGLCPDGASYVSPTYGYSVTWDPTIWSVDPTEVDSLNG